MSNWLTYSPTSGHGNGIITITADTLSSIEDRVATIIVSNSQYSLSASTSVTQKGVQLTAITFENVTWVTDVPASGGTATKDNCSYTVIGQYNNGTTGDVTEYVTVSGSLNVPVSTEMTRQNVGNLTLTANYDGFSASASISAYQAAPSITGIGFTSLVWAMDVPASGGTATKDNCTYTVYAYYDTNMSIDITDDAVITGSLVVPATTATTRHSAGTLTLVSTYSTLTASSSTTIYQEAYERPTPTADTSTYLTYYMLGNGTITFRHNYPSRTQNNKTIQYSINGGEWVSITSSNKSYSTPPSFNVNEGDFVRFKGTNTSYSLMEYGVNFYHSYLTSSAPIQIFGNIMSLIGGDNFSGLTSLPNSVEADYGTFGGLFMNQEIEDISNLLLPATTLSPSCYRQMFRDCTGFTSAENLELPATTLAPNCYSGMFDGCTSLTTAPKLPATALTDACYHTMFYGCTSLTSAPELPATTLREWSYQQMFYGCTSLNYIKCLATDISENDCTWLWTKGVASTGTFVKNPNMSSWTTDSNGIPSGWTVTNAS